MTWKNYQSAKSSSCSRWHSFTRKPPTTQEDSLDWQLPEDWPDPEETIRTTDWGKGKKIERRSTSLPGQQRVGAVCRDGSLSGARAGGACSSHQGVAYWIYQNSEADQGNTLYLVPHVPGQRAAGQATVPALAAPQWPYLPMILGFLMATMALLLVGYIARLWFKRK